MSPKASQEDQNPTEVAKDDFHKQLVAIIPRLRVQATALTRNRASADDLVQDAVCNALAGRNGFIPGTNFSAWIHRIVRNQFISNLRRLRETENIEDVPSSALATLPPHEESLVLKELQSAISQLPLEQREALTLVVAHGMSYEEIGEVTACAVGTAKSRVFRARRHLETVLMGLEAGAPTEEVQHKNSSRKRRVNRLFC